MIIHVVENLEDPVIPQPEDLPKGTKGVQQKIWEEKIKRYVEKEEVLEQGKRKLYMLLWGQCTDIMHTELKSLPDYKQFSVSYNPIELLKGIKSITFAFREQKYPQASVYYAVKALFTMSQ